MQPVRDRTPDQTYFYVVWPEAEEKSEVPLSPSKKETEQPSPGLESAIPVSSSLEASAPGSSVTREAQVMSSRRYTESPVQSPEVDYLTSRQQQASSPLTLDLAQSKSTPVTSNYSPSMAAHTQRSRGSIGQQMITLPISTVVPSQPQPQLMLSSGVTTFMGASSEMQKELGGSHPGESRTSDTPHAVLLPQSQKQLLHLGNPMSITRNPDVNGSFRRIGKYESLYVIKNDYS